MLDVSEFSKRYAVRRLTPADADAVLALCRENTQYYAYCGAQPSREQILGDMRITPPGIDPARKYYVGIYQGDVLLAVTDLVDGYPEDDIAFIGFFMMSRLYQGKNLGSAIIGELAAYLKTAGKTAIRLGIDKGNPQSTEERLFRHPGGPAGGLDDPRRRKRTMICAFAL